METPDLMVNNNLMLKLLMSSMSLRFREMKVP